MPKQAISTFTCITDLLESITHYILQLMAFFSCPQIKSTLETLSQEEAFIVEICFLDCCNFSKTYMVFVISFLTHVED